MDSFSSLLEPLLSAEDAALADRYTIDRLNVSGSELMERAGLAVAHRVEALLAQAQAALPRTPVVILCGPGNNGGDGWVAARRLWQNGIRCAIVTPLLPETLKSEAALAAQHFSVAAINDGWALSDLRSPVQHLATGEALYHFLETEAPVVIVDALFGTGLKKPVDGVYSECIQALNFFTRDHEAQVLAVDIPSGLYCDGQRSSDIHVRAHETLAIQFRKITHLSGPHWLSCGTVNICDIGLQQSRAPRARALVAAQQSDRMLLHPPTRKGHKGSYGHVGVLSGARGLEGAAELSAYAALRAGAGLSTLLFPRTLSLRALAEIMRAWTLERPTAFVVGPGIDHTRLELARRIVAHASAEAKSMVVDAGALPLLLEGPHHNELVATPHPGEAARLLTVTAADVEDDRLRAAENLMSTLSSFGPLTLVLKGDCPILAHQTHGLIVCQGALSTLSVGGSGDVFAGICAALFAQTDGAFEAALLATAVHLEAGRRLAQVQSRGFLAHEIADEVARVLFKTR